MAITTISKPTYPNVPQEPGVPNVLRSINQSAAPVIIMVADVVSIIQMFTGPQ
jgi:hypothetical protein